MAHAARRRLQGISEERLRRHAQRGRPYGGAVTAAMFLKEFADPTPWVHLDIAGTAWLDEAKPFLAKGPTGVARAHVCRPGDELGGLGANQGRE